MSKDRRERCGDCRFFGEHSRLSGIGIAEGVGSCRRYAPRGPLLDLQSSVGIDYFPPVPVDGWCGEFQQAPNEVEKLAARVEEADRDNAARDLLASVARRKPDIGGPVEVLRTTAELNAGGTQAEAELAEEFGTEPGDIANPEGDIWGSILETSESGLGRSRHRAGTVAIRPDQVQKARRFGWVIVGDGVSREGGETLTLVKR